MAKSLKKYKRPPRVDKDPAEEVEVLPQQEEAMHALELPPITAAPLIAVPVKKKARKRRPRAAQKSEISDDDYGDRVDSGNEGGGLDLQIPVCVNLS